MPKNVQTLKDLGTRTEYKTGAMKEANTTVGKGRYDLFSPIALRIVAIVNQTGAIKYSDRNWEKGIPVCRLIDSAIRHLQQVLNRETDEEHAAQAAWNCLALVHELYLIEHDKLPKELDDRPCYGVPLPTPELYIQKTEQKQIKPISNRKKK